MEDSAVGRGVEEGGEGEVGRGMEEDAVGRGVEEAGEGEVGRGMEAGGVTVTTSADSAKRQRLLRRRREKIQKRRARRRLGREEAARADGDKAGDDADAGVRVLGQEMLSRGARTSSGTALSAALEPTQGEQRERERQGEPAPPSEEELLFVPQEVRQMARAWLDSVYHYLRENAPTGSKRWRSMTV